MLRLLSIFGLAQISFVFLGNALKSIVTSTVFTSEGDFASFLNISVDKTGILVELLIGSSVLALALTPVILTEARARKVTALSALASLISFGLLGLVMILNPALFVRELAVVATFSMGGFCIAFFAPLAQQAINAQPDQSSRVMLTTVWTSAQPIAFLITPQLVKYLAHDIGTGNFFLLFALMPLAFMALSRFVLPKVEAGDETASKPVSISKRSLFLIFAFLISFELMTASVSFAGLLAPVSVGLMLVFGLLLVWAISHFSQAAKASDIKLPKISLLLLIALFILEFPSTGFYDAAYLVRHLCSSTLIEDRASLGAAAQILAVFIGGAIYARWPGALAPLIGIGIFLLAAGTAAFRYYPDLAVDAPFFYYSKMVAAAGMGLVTTVIIGQVMAQCRDNPIFVLLPAFVIMFGTEFGLEILEILFEAGKLAGLDEVGAYRAVFDAQVLLILLAVPFAAWGLILHHRERQAQRLETEQPS